MSVADADAAAARWLVAYQRGTVVEISLGSDLARGPYLDVGVGATQHEIEGRGDVVATLRALATALEQETAR